MINMRTRNLVASIFLLFLCGGYAYLTVNLPTRAIENSTQPSFFPWVIVIFLTGLTLLLLIQVATSGKQPNIERRNQVPVKRLIYGLLLSLAYLFALPKLGFVAANIPLFGGLMYLYGERRPIWIGLGSIIISVMVFLVFRKIFQIILPVGVLGDIF